MAGNERPKGKDGVRGYERKGYRLPSFRTQRPDQTVSVALSNGTRQRVLADVTGPTSRSSRQSRTNFPLTHPSAAIFIMIGQRDGVRSVIASFLDEGWSNGRAEGR